MRFFPGETVSLKATYMNVEGKIVDPSGTHVYIYDPDGNEVASDTPTKVEDGIYRYNYDLPEDASKGDWCAKFTGIVTGMHVIETEPFRVIEQM